MMKINFPLLDAAIELQETTILTLEDTQVFAQVVQLLYQYHEESKLRIFNEQQKSLKATELMLVTDVLGFEVNSAATLKLIYGDLENQLNEKPEVKLKIEELSGKITELISYELLEHELDLEEDEITILELFKALGIKIETTSDTIYEKLMEIVQVFRYLSKKKLLVFVNVCAYLTQTELDELRNYIALSNVTVLFIEPRKVTSILPQYVLDQDYFLNEE